MKRVLYIFAILGLLLQNASWFTPGVANASAPAASEGKTASEVMPGYAPPSQPIPYHKPGYPSKMGSDTRAQLARTYQPWAASFNSLSPEQQVEGLSFGPEYDPLIGNYTMLNWDQLAIVNPDGNSGSGAQRLKTYSAGAINPDGTISLVNPPTLAQNVNSSGSGYSQSRAGDINGDGVDEILSLTNGKIQVGNPSAKRFIIGAPAIVSPNPGVTWMFARGYDDQLWLLPDGVNWVPLGGTLTSSPTAVVVSPGVAVVSLLGTNNEVFFCGVAFFDSKYNAVCEWIPGSQEGKFMGEPAIAGTTPDLDLFVRSSDNQLWHQRYGSGVWESLGGYITSSPAVISRDGRIDVVAAGYDQAVWHLWLPNGSTTWSAWERLGSISPILGSPAIISTASDKYDVFATRYEEDGNGRITKTAIEQLSYNAGWGSWADITTPGVSPWPAAQDPTSSPSATVVNGSSQVALGYRGKDHVYQAVHDTAWSAFSAQPRLGMWSSLYPIENARSLALGHFLPDGRMQLLNAYVSASDATHLYLASYAFSGGFTPVGLKSDGGVTVATVDIGHVVSLSDLWIDNAVGDFDGDGVDELALIVGSSGYLYLYVIKINSDGTVGKVADDGKNQGFIEITPASNRNVVLTHGDYDGNGHEDLAVFNADRANPSVSELKIYYQIAINQATGKYGFGTPAAKNVTWGYNVWYAYAAASGNFGDFAGANSQADEIAYAGVVRTQYLVPGTNPVVMIKDFYVKTHMLYMTTQGDITLADKTDREWKPVTYGGTYGVDDPQMRVLIAAPDLDRDNKAEVAVFFEVGHGCYHYNMFGSCDGRGEAQKQVYYYKYNPQVDPRLVQKGSMTLDVGGNVPDAPAAEFLSGNFGGNGLYLARPSYRLVENLANPVVRVNAPPKIVDGGVVINPNDNAVISLITDLQNQISVTSKSSWNVAVAASASWGVKDISNTKLSLEGSYGQDFENVDTHMLDVKISATTPTTNDALIYALTDFHFFEYPLLDGATGGQSNMTVTWPRPTGANESARTVPSTSASCGILINPGHDVKNPASYPSTVQGLPGYSSANAFYGAVGINTVNGGDVKITWTDQTGTSYTQTSNWKIAGGFEQQWGAKDLYSINLSVKGTYTGSYGARQSITMTNTMEVTTHVGAEASKYEYTITAYFYQDANGTLVLDYVIGPDGFLGNWWDATSGLWAKPDLAFIRPRSNSDCPLVQGQSQKDISPEITFDNRTPVSGSDVMVTARLHNFSLGAVGAAQVRFYRGDPETGGTLITCDPGPAPTPDTFSLDARSAIDVSCKFQASGTGEQRIYAVASTAEQEKDDTNNKAYGVLSVTLSSAGGADPGRMVAAEKKEGILVKMGTGAGQETSLFVPYRAVVNRAITSFKLEQAVGPSQHTFRIAANKENANGVWSETDQTFGLVQQADHTIPAAYVSVQYALADLRPGDDEASLRLFYWNPTLKKWQDEQTSCGPVVRNTVDHVLMAPVCHTGTFRLASRSVEFYMAVIFK